MGGDVARRILSDFLRGLTVVGLARKYGRTKVEIENVIRRAMR
jgi:Mor family transcriptional regulator